MLPVRLKCPRRLNSLVILSLLTLLTLGQTFVIVTDHSRPEGWVLFDARINGGSKGVQVQQAPEESERGNEQEFYTYRISHHKTQPWIHRLVHLDKNGRLHWKKSVQERLNPCNNNPIYPSSFLVYIDIISYPHYVRNNSTSTVTCSDGDSACTYFDYVSFPLTVITSPPKRRLDCEGGSDGGRPNRVASPSDSDGGEIQHLTRSVDDIYVSFPVEGHYCHHASEKLTNIEHFLPASVRSGCHTTATVISNEHFFAVEGSTGDLVLRADWCLFEPVATVQILLHLKCSPLSSNPHSSSDKAVMSWDQMVHFIIHRFDASAMTSSSSSHGSSTMQLGNSIMEFHPIHRMRREMRNQAPYFEQTMYIASVPEEQSPGITVTTISATDPENSPLIYSMTSLLDARSQQFFSLDSKSGIISTVDRLDREKMDVHYFRIVATDSGIPPRTGTATLQVISLPSVHFSHLCSGCSPSWHEKEKSCVHKRIEKP